MKKILIITLVLTLLSSAFFVAKYICATRQTQEENEVVEKTKGIAFSGEEKPIDPKKPQKELTKKEKAEEDGYDYEALKEKNEDCIGWIIIPDTGVNHPVMWRENNNSYYLNKDFDRQYARRGTPFVDGFCKPTGNLIIYGHNTLDVNGFGQLISYTSKDFWEKHKTIQFYLFDEKCEFEIFAVCKVSAAYDKEYYEFYGYDTEEKLGEFLEKAQKRSLYDTGVEVSPSDKFIMLSTCEYSQNNGRLVVFAREITTP